MRPGTCFRIALCWAVTAPHGTAKGEVHPDLHLLNGARVARLPGLLVSQCSAHSANDICPARGRGVTQLRHSTLASRSQHRENDEEIKAEQWARRPGARLSDQSRTRGMTSLANRSSWCGSSRVGQKM